MLNHANVFDQQDLIDPCGSAILAVSATTLVPFHLLPVTEVRHSADELIAQNLDTFVTQCLRVLRLFLLRLLLSPSVCLLLLLCLLLALALGSITGSLGSSLVAASLLQSQSRSLPSKHVQ